MRFLGSHSEIKIIALCLSIALYFLTWREITIERQVDVRLVPGQVVDLPEGWMVQSIEPRVLEKIELQGPASLIDPLLERGIEPRFLVATPGLSDGEQQFTVDGDLLQLDPSIRLLYGAGEVVRVTFAQLKEMNIPLAATPEVVDLPAGIEVKSIRLDFNELRLQGPESLLLATAEAPLALESVSLAELDPLLTEEEKTIAVPVSVQIPEGLRPVNDGLVKALITVRPTPEVRNGTFVVEVQAPPGFLERNKVTLSPSEVPLEVSGPANALREVTDLQQVIQAYVRLTLDMPVGEARAATVKVSAPSWMTVVTPTQVQVTVSNREFTGSNTGQGVPVIPFEQGGDAVPVIERPRAEDVKDK